MKKIIYILIIIISVFSFFVLYNNQKLIVNNNMEKVEQNLSNSYNIIMPNSLQNKNQTNTCNSIIQVLKKHNANMYYSKIGSDGRIIKYIYLSDFSYFNNFVITKGRVLNNNDLNSDKYLSTEKTGDKNQIGTISSFDGKKIFEIRTLKSMINSNYLFAGDCTVQLPANYSINDFIKDLGETLNVDGIQTMPKYNVAPEYTYNQWILPALYLIIILLILYSILKSYKKFGVQKLLGYSSKDIWLGEVSKLVISQFFIMIIVNIVMSIFLFKEYNYYYFNFLKILLSNELKQLIILFIISSIPFIYLINITVINILKNKLPIKHIILFNSILKVMLVILFFTLINQGIQNYGRIKNVFNVNYKKWDSVKNYYVIPSLSSKNGEQDVNTFCQNLTAFYHNVNKQGAIWADFFSYSPEQRPGLLADKKNNYERDNVTVNPNYLKSNVVYDEKNNAVSISENDKNLILLVPAEYKKYEKNIIDLWEYQKKGSAENSITRNEKIEIIYTKPNQKLFSYEADVNPNDGNLVTDPIVRVITDKNGSSDFDYLSVIGCEGTPVKIKASSVINPEQSIIMDLQKVGLSKYVDKISPANDAVAFESKSVYKLLVFIIVGLIILTLSMLLIITQNIYCIFEQYKKQLAIRQFHGYKFIDKYSECFQLLVISWIISFVIIFFMKLINIKIEVILVSIFILFDLLMTTLTIKFVSRRKITSIIKGSN